MCYARRYANVLESGNATPLLHVSNAVRRHSLEAMTIFSKYCGKYSLWKDICSKYQLKWSSVSEENNLRYFTNYLHGNENFDVMIAWLKDTLHKLPSHVGNVLLYNTLTGLRFSEGLLSIKLIQTDFEHYANKELGVLENFRYPEFISKRTKKSYLTAYDDTILEVARNAVPLVRSWNVIRAQLKKCGIFSVHAKYCRAIFATWLRKQGGIEQEVIDLYQGRVPTSIFRAHYLKTNVKEDRERILQAVHELKEELEK